MSELIRTYKNENNETVVDGRELHQFLEVNERYNDWFPRMLAYGFTENVDFISFTENSVKGGRPAINHAMSLDMAKEVAMIQRTDKGKQARQYFIEVEKQYKGNTLSMSNTELLLETALKHERDLVEVNGRLEKLEAETIINSSQRRKLQGMVQSTVIKALGGKQSNAYKNQSINKSAFSNCYNQVKKVFDVASYADIPKVRFDEALQLIPKWQPSLELQAKITEANGQGHLWEVV